MFLCVSVFLDKRGKMSEEKWIETLERINRNWVPSIMEMRLTPDQKIAGSTPAVLGFLFVFLNLFFLLTLKQMTVCQPVSKERGGDSRTMISSLSVFGEGWKRDEEGGF